MKAFRWMSMYYKIKLCLLCSFDISTCIFLNLMETFSLLPPKSRLWNSILIVLYAHPNMAIVNTFMILFQIFGKLLYFY